MIRKVLALGLLVLVIGCTSQQMAKGFGGSMTVDLPPGQKLVVATWKNSDLWYLTRPMRDGENAEVQSFRESSSFGIMEGVVKFVETK